MANKGFTFTYGKVRHVQGNISEGSIPLIMGDSSLPSYPRRDVSVVYHTGPEPLSEQISAQYPYQYRCNPSNLDFNPIETPRPVVVAIGEKSTPLSEWIRRTLDTTEVWVYFPKDRQLKGVLPLIRKVGRWIGEAFHKRHMEGDFLGQYLEKLSVREDKLTFEHVYKTHNDLIKGIQEDILQFREFVEALASKPYKSTKSKNPQGPEHTAIVTLALDLCAQATSLSTLGDLQNLSFFVSHIPLFWEISQRQDFVNAFKRIRDKKIIKFARVEGVMFTGRKYIKPNWHEDLPTSNWIPYRRLYQQCNLAYQTSVSLFVYQRHCYLHFKDYTSSASSASVETITSNLHELFPSAIPKAWNALYDHVLPEIPELVDELKCQPGFLN